VGTEQEVGAPVDRRPEMPELTGRRHLVAVLDGAPAEESHGERHREAELDVVAGVVVAASQVHLNSSKMNLVFFFLQSLTFITFTSLCNKVMCAGMCTNKLVVNCYAHFKIKRG
jgi:hypothetical protein